jgi:hypothetical protein
MRVVDGFHVAVVDLLLWTQKWNFGVHKGGGLASWGFRRVHIVTKSSYELSGVRPSVCMYQRGPQQTGFLEISCVELSWKSDQKIQILLQSGKNIRHFTWRPKTLQTWRSELLRRSGGNNGVFDFGGEGGGMR